MPPVFPALGYESELPGGVDIAGELSLEPFSAGLAAQPLVAPVPDLQEGEDAVKVSITF